MAERKYFGTDGVRGRVGEAPITPELVMRLGYAAGRVLAHDAGTLHGARGATPKLDGASGAPAKADGAGSAATRGEAARVDAARSAHDAVRKERPGVLIGKDTRISGYLLEAALEAGLAAAGVDVYLCGPLPTPAIAHLTRALRLSAGVVVSASHNPYDDNGIKFFAGNGAKLADATELAIERAMDAPMVCVPSASLGKARRVDDAAGRYIEFCKSTFPNELDLKGRRIVVDCAHGAAYHVAPTVFRELGAEVIAVAAEPDGVNINAGVGATHPEHLSAKVLAHHADLGIALDGDADRLVLADAQGRVYDGDELLYVIARDYQHRGVLAGGVVGTQMSNLGFEQALARHGIALERAKVGDRYVLEKMVEKSWRLGGENSGHIICLDKHTTGDAIIAALAVLRALIDSGQTLGEATASVALFPQHMINVPLRRGIDWHANVDVAKAERAATSALGSAGRVLLRPSGTEPVLRVMVEARDAALAQTHAETLAEVIARVAGQRL